MTEQAKRDQLTKLVAYEEETDELRHHVLTDEGQTDEEFAHGFAQVLRRQRALRKKRSAVIGQPKALSAPKLGLTKQQAIVLALHRQGRSPTEIGRQLRISSQAVHGHLTRLRGKGVVAPLAGGRRLSASASPDGALDQVRQVIAHQTELLIKRDKALVSESERIQFERREIAASLSSLAALEMSAES